MSSEAGLGASVLGAIMGASVGVGYELSSFPVKGPRHVACVI